MAGTDAFRYGGRTVLVVGGATGIGAAVRRLAADLSAHVVVMDFAQVDDPSVTALALDLRDQSSIDAAVDACDGPLHAVFSCAGVANQTPGVDLVNFLGQRHLVERLLAQGKIARGGAIGMISSVAGLGWERDLPLLLEYLATPDFDAGTKWLAEHSEKAGYAGSKQAVSAYVAQKAYPFLRDHGVRINGTAPGPTDTPLAQANADTWLTFAGDYRADVGVEASTPEEQAYPLLFLCSPVASHVNGVVMTVDAGYVGAGITGSYDAPMVRKRLGLG